MNKKHWNTLVLDGSVPPKLIRELVQHSYDLVVASLPAKSRPKAGFKTLGVKCSSPVARAARRRA
jgi:predicted DNA-binding protein (MmcQ/YjbR family)